MNSIFGITCRLSIKRQHRTPYTRARGEFCSVHNRKVGASVGFFKGSQKFGIQLLVVMMLTFTKVATRLVVTAKGAGRSQAKRLMVPRARSERHRPSMTAERQPRRCQEKTATTNRRDTRSTSGKTTATKQMCLDTRRHSSRVNPMM